MILGAIVVLCCGGGGLVFLLGNGSPDTASTVVTNSDGSTQEAPKNNGVPQAAMGATVEYPGNKPEIRVTVSDIKRNVKSDNQFDKPDHGGYATVKVELTALKGTSDIGPSNFRLIGADGTVFKAEFLVAGIDGQFDAMTEIQEGQKKVGVVVFDVDPAKVASGKIELSSDGGSPLAYWTF